MVLWLDDVLSLGSTTMKDEEGDVVVAELGLSIDLCLAFLWAIDEIVSFFE
jgi:hypothetical protein